MEDTYTLFEPCKLPSKGKIYPVPVAEEVKVRSMTTEDEMRRLARSERPYKNICDVIDSCLIDKLGISSYDLCLGDFQKLLYSLRTATYGPNCEYEVMCPYCGKVKKIKANIAEFSVSEYTEDIQKYMEFTLPVSKKHVKLRFQTPRILDDVTCARKSMMDRHPDMPDPAFLLRVTSAIDTFDNEHYDSAHLENLVRKLPMNDTNTILMYADKLNQAIGLDTKDITNCEGCGTDFPINFRIGSQFYSPTVEF